MTERPSFLAAFNRGERAVAELVGPAKAREVSARQQQSAACRRRAAVSATCSCDYDGIRLCGLLPAERCALQAPGPEKR